MLETFSATLTPMLMLFACMVIGFMLNKFKILPRNAATVLSKLENFVLVPALIIKTFMNYCRVESLINQYKIILYSLAALILALLISIPLSKVFENKDYYKRNIYKYALSFGNFSFMGAAIVPEILGQEMLYHYMLYILPLNIAVYTWGLMILIPQDEREHHPLRRLINPIFIAIIVGAVFGLFNVQKFIPGFVSDTVNGLASCMGPLAMVLTGFVVGGYKISSLLKNKKVYVASLLRLFIIPAILIVVLYFIKADKTTMVMTLFAYATPLGLNTVVFPAAYGGDTSIGASMAMISHTLSVITIPLMYSLLIFII